MGTTATAGLPSDSRYQLGKAVISRNRAPVSPAEMAVIDREDRQLLAASQAVVAGQ